MSPERSLFGASCFGFSYDKLQAKCLPSTRSMPVPNVHYNVDLKHLHIDVQTLVDDITGSANSQRSHIAHDIKQSP